jgi:hypothetical protein
VSAAIIPFVLREKCKSKPSNFPAVAFRPALLLDDLTMDHVDTAPCEYVRPEMRADFQHLRRWRKSAEQAQSYTFKAVITVIVTGFVGAVWLGIKVMLGK